MKINFLTIFPQIFDSYINESIMGRAQEGGAVDFTSINIRDFSTNKHGNVDDTPAGGGAGMVMQVEPIHRAIESLDLDRSKSRVILLSAKGKAFTQRDAERLSSYENITFICGRYEGVDERVADHIVDEELRIGDYVLTGGELGALVISDAVVRLLPGVLGNVDSAVYESHSKDGYLEHPQYSKPSEYNGWEIPEVLRSGDHAAIEKWRQEQATKK